MVDTTNGSGGPRLVLPIAMWGALVLQVAGFSFWIGTVSSDVVGVRRDLTSLQAEHIAERLSALDTAMKDNVDRERRIEDKIDLMATKLR